MSVVCFTQASWISLRLVIMIHDCPALTLELLAQIQASKLIPSWDKQCINGCPYLLTMALERFHTPKEEKPSTLIVYRDDELHLTLPAWFNFYNGRQTTEASRKRTSSSRCTR